MMDDRLLRYGPYTHATSQTNKCGNYWFPINVLCSNINPQIEGDENSIAVTSAGRWKRRIYQESWCSISIEPFFSAADISSSPNRHQNR
jgi:hypothetical protein